MSDARYQRHTALIHLAIAALSLGAAAWLGCLGSFNSVPGLALGAATNALIGIEKLDLLRRGKA